MIICSEEYNLNSARNKIVIDKNHGEEIVHFFYQVQTIVKKKLSLPFVYLIYYKLYFSALKMSVIYEKCFMKCRKSQFLNKFKHL